MLEQMWQKLREIKGNNQVDFSEKKNQAVYRNKVTAKDEKIAQRYETSKFAQQHGK